MYASNILKFTVSSAHEQKFMHTITIMTSFVSGSVGTHGYDYAHLSIAAMIDTKITAKIAQ